MRDIQAQLVKSIVSALYKAEEAGDLVICTGAPHGIGELVSEEVRSVFTGDLFTPLELWRLSVLISFAVADKRFYDMGMQTQIGCSPDEMQELGARIRDLTVV